MQVSSILTAQRTVEGALASSKKRAMELVADVIAKGSPGLDADDLFAALMARERLGSTGIGEGIAIPHCRLHNCTTPLGTLVKLQQKIDFDAIDDAPIDLLFVLVVPEEATDEHLQILATLAELFSHEDLRQQLRNAQSDDELYKAIINYPRDQAA